MVTKLVMGTPALEVLKDRFVEQRLLSKWWRFVFKCFSQYMSLYISFTLMSTTKLLRKKHTLKVWLRAWSLHWIFATYIHTFWNQILYVFFSQQTIYISIEKLVCFTCSSSAALFVPFFSPTVECSHSIQISLFSEPVPFRQFYYIYWNFPIFRFLC
jgi:hypothetical protein